METRQPNMRLGNPRGSGSRSCLVGSSFVDGMLCQCRITGAENVAMDTASEPPGPSQSSGSALARLLLSLHRGDCVRSVHLRVAPLAENQVKDATLLLRYSAFLRPDPFLSRTKRATE